MKKKILVLILVLIFFPIVNADVISLNSGGSGNIIINPYKNIEGFFFCSPDTCAGLGYNCDSWSDNCGGTINCGTCASGYTCTAGICTAAPVSPGGGGGTPTPTINVNVTPTEFNIKLAVNTNIEKTIKVTNLGSSSINIDIKQLNLDDLIILKETSLNLASKESKDLHVVFVAPSQPGIFTGRILIGNKQILVILNVKTKLLLFDSNIIVLNKDYKVPQGDKLKTQVTLIPLGDEDRLDVTLNYEIKDYEGEIYLTQSETVLAEKQINFKRDFGTGMLPLGKYIIGLELIYPNGVAPSSAHFDVVEKVPINFGILVFFLIAAILIVSILIIILLIVKKRRKKNSKEEVEK